MSGKKKKVVVVGGGTGTYTILRGLKRYADKLDLSVVVTMADSGGSTGRLRDEFGQLPIGDARMALTALSADIDEHDELLRELFLYRFNRGEGLVGHNFGNLLLTALTDILGSEVSAIETASKLLRVRGRVIPVTTENVHLKVVYDDGVEVVGEHEIDMPSADRHERRIKELSLYPEASLNQSAKEVLSEADLIILGPGDLYTGILANAVVSGFKETILSSRARLVYVANLMSRSGQTIGMDVVDYLNEIVKYVGRSPESVILNTTAYPPELLEKYRDEGNYPVEAGEVENYTKVVRGDFLMREKIKTQAGDVLERSLIRHDSDKLAKAIFDYLDQD